MSARRHRTLSCRRGEVFHLAQPSHRERPSQNPSCDTKWLYWFPVIGIHFPVSPFKFPAPLGPLQSGYMVSGQKPRMCIVLQAVMGTRLWLRSDPGLRNRKALEGRKSIPGSHIPKEPRRRAVRFLDIWFKRCVLRRGEIGLSCKGLGA